MNSVIIEIDGITDEDSIEQTFESRDSGLDLTRAGFGRTKRFSHLGDVVTIAGQIVSLATFAKTLLQLFISNEAKKSQANTSKANEPTDTVIRIKNKLGETVTITSANKFSISEILKKHLEE